VLGGAKRHQINYKVNDWLNDNVGGAQMAENLSWSIEREHLISPVGGDASLTWFTTQSISEWNLENVQMLLTNQ